MLITPTNQLPLFWLGLIGMLQIGFVFVFVCFVLLAGHSSSGAGEHKDAWSAAGEGGRTSDSGGPVSSSHRAAESWNFGQVLCELIALFFIIKKDPVPVG